MSNTIRKSLVVVAIASLMAVAQTQASDQVSQKLLSDFWSTTQGKESNRYYAGQKDRSAESLYAFALVKTHQHDVKMALRSIQELQKVDPQNAKPLRLKVWLELRQDQIKPAMATLVQFVAMTVNNEEISDFERRDAMAFAGRIFGFLDGPVAYKVPDADREATLTQILGRMTESDQSSFDHGYGRVANKFRELMSEKMNVDAEAAAQDAVVQKAKHASLAAREKQLHEAEQRTAAERQRTRSQINKGLTDIARYDQAFANQQAHYAPYRVWPRNRYFVHTSGSSKHKVKTHVVGYAVGRPTYLRSPYYDLQARRNILAGHYAQLRDLGAGQMKSLNKELKDITKAKNRTMNQKLRALKPSGKTVTKSVALKAKSRSIMTFEQFPLELERQLLLAATR